MTGHRWFAGITVDHLFSDCPARWRGEKTLRECGWWFNGGDDIDPYGTDICGICRRRLRRESAADSSGAGLSVGGPVNNNGIERTGGDL